MTDINPDTMLVRGRNHLATKIHDEQLILSGHDGVYYGLSATASRVWELLDSPSCLRLIIEKLHEEYAVQRDELERDVTALLDDLLRRGLVEHAGAQDEDV